MTDDVDKHEQDMPATAGKKSKWRRWLPFAMLAALIATAYALGLHNYVTLEQLQAHKERILDIRQNYPILSVAGFMAIYTLSVALSLPIATLFTLLSGFLFGKVLGTLYVVISATLGASIVFAVAKTSLGNALRERAGKYYHKLSANMERNAVGYLFFLRLVPVFPFFLVNVAPALFNIPFRVFVLTTFFGILPGSFVYVNVGETLGDIQSLSDLVSTEALVAFTLLGLFALLPGIYKQIRGTSPPANKIGPSGERE